MFKFPKDLIDFKQIKSFCVEDIITFKKKTNYYILDIDINEEEGGGWAEGEGWLSSLVALRSDIMKKDFRLLYLAWLKATSLLEEDELIEKMIKEPPLPYGLKELSKSLKDFVDLFEVDKNDIKLSQKKSTGIRNKLKKIDYEKLIPKLSAKERNDFLLRVAKGEKNIEVYLNNRLASLMS